MRTTRPASATNRTGVVVLTTDPAFEQLVHATFKASAQIDLQVIGGDVVRCRRSARRRRRDRRHHRPRRQPRSGDAGARSPGGADRRLAAGRGGRAELRRRRGAPAAADAGGRLPGQAGAAGRTGAHLRARRAAGGERDQRGPDLHVPARGRRRRRDHDRDPDRDAAAQQRRARPSQHLPGRSQFPERRLRRLSRPRAAARPQGNRTAAGAARPPAPGDHAVAAQVGAVR